MPSGLPHLDSSCCSLQFEPILIIIALMNMKMDLIMLVIMMIIYDYNHNHDVDNISQDENIDCDNSEAQH